LLNSLFMYMLFIRVALLCFWKESTAKVEGRWHFKFSAVAAHRRPPFQTMHKSFGGKVLHPPCFCCNGYGLILIVLLRPCNLSGRIRHKSSPSHSGSETHIFYAEVHIGHVQSSAYMTCAVQCIYDMCSSVHIWHVQYKVYMTFAVQERGAFIPPFGSGLGWPDFG